MDREGPDGGVAIRAIGFGIYAAGFSLLMFGTVGSELLRLPTIPWIGFTLSASIAMGALAALLSLSAANLAGSAITEVMISGTTTPYTEQYSYQQALVMQGRLDEAISTLEATIAEPESTVDVRIRAAELHTREAKNHVRAAELFREVIRHPKCTVGEEAYAANRLVDLLNGPLGQPGRALVELRRLADRYPSSPIGENARAALRTLKSAGTERDPFAPPLNEA
jgi:hypothetical protein